MVYITDIDGTLIDSKAQLSGTSRKIITELLEDGLVFTVASARAVFTIEMLLKGIPFQWPIIALNGAYLYCPLQKEIIEYNVLEPHHAELVFTLIKKYQLSPLISSYSETEHLTFGKVINHGMQWYFDDRKRCRDPRAREGFDLYKILAEKIAVITIIGEFQEISRLYEELQQMLGDKVNILMFENKYHRGWYWISVTSQSACKSVAAKTLCSMQGASIDQLVAFGDDVNDIQMLKTAGLGIAVENAEEKVKEAADKVIGSNDDDAVVHFIRDHWRGA